MKKRLFIELVLLPLLLWQAALLHQGKCKRHSTRQASSRPLQRHLSTGSSPPPPSPPRKVLPMTDPIQFLTPTSYFKVKTAQKSGVIMYAVDQRETFLFCIELFQSHLRYIFRVNNHIRVLQDKLQPPHNISDNQPHEVSIQRPTSYHNIFRVDDTTSIIASTPSINPNGGGDGGGEDRRNAGFDMAGRDLEVSEDWDDNEIEMDIYIGGMNGRMFGELVDEARARDGFVGCVSSLDLDGHTWPMLKERVQIDERFEKQVVKGCIASKNKPSHAEKCTCLNGGKCVEKRCVCASRYTGKHCQIRSISYTFSSEACLIYEFAKKRTTLTDFIDFSLTTTRNNASLVTLLDSSSHHYILVYLSGGKVHTTVKLPNHGVTTVVGGRVVSDGTEHRVVVERKGGVVILRVDEKVVEERVESDGSPIYFKNQAKVIVSGQFPLHEIQFLPYEGVLSGLLVNGIDIFEKLKTRPKDFFVHGSIKPTVSLNNTLHLSTLTPTRQSTTTYQEPIHINPKGAHYPLKDELIYVARPPDSLCVLPNLTFCENFEPFDDSFILPFVVFRDGPVNSIVFPATTLLPNYRHRSTNVVKVFKDVSNQDHITKNNKELDNSYHLKLPKSFLPPHPTLNPLQQPRQHINTSQSIFHQQELLSSHSISSIITNVVLSASIIISCIILVFILSYAISKFSVLKTNEVKVVEDGACKYKACNLITTTAPEVSEVHCPEFQVKEWFI